eukprot:Opistho-2@66689
MDILCDSEEKSTMCARYNVPDVPKSHKELLLYKNEVNDCVSKLDCQTLKAFVNPGVELRWVAISGNGDAIRDVFHKFQALQIPFVSEVLSTIDKRIATARQQAEPDEVLDIPDEEEAKDLLTSVEKGLGSLPEQLPVPSSLQPRAESAAPARTDDRPFPSQQRLGNILFDRIRAALSAKDPDSGGMNKYDRVVFRILTANFKMLEEQTAIRLKKLGLFDESQHVIPVESFPAKPGSGVDRNGFSDDINKRIANFYAQLISDPHALGVPHVLCVDT